MAHRHARATATAASVRNLTTPESRIPASLRTEQPGRCRNHSGVDLLDSAAAADGGTAESADYSAVFDQRQSARGGRHVLERAAGIRRVGLAVDCLKEGLRGAAPKGGGLRLSDREIGAVSEHAVDDLEIDERSGIVHDGKGAA